VGSEVVSAVQFSTPGHALRYFVIAGSTPAEILTRFTSLTGRAARPPAWSFGLWLSTSFLTDWNADTVRSLVTGMAERGIPLSVFHLDSFWMRPFHFCDFEWDRSRIPDPVALLADLHDAGVRVCAWINPYLGQESPMFKEASSRGYLVRRPNGDVWQWDQWQSGMGIVDLTNERARTWWADKLRVLVDMGVDCFKTDFGELIPTDVVWSDGSDPELMHNYYSYLYNETVFNVLRERRGEGEAVLFARSATAGGQQFPVHWGGDPEPSYVSMAETLRGGLSLGLSGFSFWSHDIGGFEGTPSPAVFKRWVPFGLLSSHSRLHGSISYRVPWDFDEDAVEVLRRFTRLKMRLMPYIWTTAEEAATRGLPVLRAMVLEFPEDPTCAHLDRQFMLGADLLVAPVFCDEGRVDYYLPAGVWTHLITGEVVRGGAWQHETHDFLSLPVFVRPGAVVPTGPESGPPERDHRDEMTLEWYAPAEGFRELAVPGPRAEAAPASFTLRRNGRHLSVQARNATDWRVALPGVRHVTAEGDVSVQTTQRGVLLTPPAGRDRLDAYVVGEHA
jgi:alpha-D-xyloside xylohydrolase